LDLELSSAPQHARPCRGSALAAGLLFRSNVAESEGSTALIYDWQHNQLEAIFNVPPNWQPHAAAAPPPDARFDGAFDAAAFLCATPSFAVSRTTSAAPLSPLPSPGLAAESSSELDLIVGELDSVVSVTGSLEGERQPPPTPPSLSSLDHGAAAAAAAAAASPLPRSGSSLSQSLHRGSYLPAAVAGGSGAAAPGGSTSFAAPGGLRRTGTTAGSGGGGGGGGGGGASFQAGFSRVGSFPRAGSGITRLASLSRRPSLLGSPRASQLADGESPRHGPETSTPS